MYIFYLCSLRQVEIVKNLPAEDARTIKIFFT
jgi:hypothetical protein